MSVRNTGEACCERTLEEFRDARSIATAPPIDCPYKTFGTGGQIKSLYAEQIPNLRCLFSTRPGVAIENPMKFERLFGCLRGGHEQSVFS